MKSLKKAMAALLAVVIVITGGAFAFAENAETVITWEANEDYSFDALLAGEAIEGTFTIKAMEEYENVYYTFDAEKAGYYTITFDWYPVDFSYVAETFEEGKAYGERENYIFSDDGEAVALYYLDEGINYIGFNLYSSDSYDSYAKIDFIGEEITDVVFDETEIESLLIGTEIYEYEYEEGFYWGTVFEIEFDNSKTVTFYDNALIFDMKNPLEAGEVELTLNVFEYSKDYVVTAYEITDVISSVSIVEESSKEVEILYDGSINHEKLHGMTLEITFADGKKATSPIDYGYADVEFPNGKMFYFEIYYNDWTDENIYLDIVFPGENEEVFYHEKCEVIDASKEANKEALKENISWPFEFSGMIFQWNLMALDYAETFGQMISILFAAFGDAAVNYETAFSNLFTQLISYIMYSLSR